MGQMSSRGSRFGTAVGHFTGTRVRLNAAMYSSYGMSLPESLHTAASQVLGDGWVTAHFDCKRWRDASGFTPGRHRGGRYIRYPSSLSRAASRDHPVPL